MISICVFRRYGLAVPILFFVIGFLLERWTDHRHGVGFSSGHFRVMGLNLLITGGLTGILSCVVDPSPRNDPAYSAIQDMDVEDVRKNVQGSLERFVYEEAEEDMFCYIPLNRCAMGLMAAGLLLMVIDMFAN